MNFCFRFLIPLVFVFTLGSCSNELDVIAEYEENASVYALLDPNQSIQFVKINKVFVNPNARATDVAKIADSLYFDSINPELIEIGTGRRIPLTRANIALKDSGTFATSPNYMYVTTERIYPVYNYMFEMKLPSSGKTVTATTNICYTPNILMPVTPFQKVINIQYSTANTFLMQFITPRNGKIFDAFLYFNYTEVNKADTNIKTDKTVSWKILRGYPSSGTRGGEIVSYRLPGTLFYDNLLSNIPEDPSVFRRFRPCEFICISGNEELFSYIQASTPSIGIVQKQSEYSNLENGVGIFASRSTFYLNDIALTDQMKTVIVSNADLRKMGFVK